jgi:uncharacterized protein
MRRADRLSTDKDEIAKILTEGKIIHIAFQDENEPYIVTMNYGYDFMDDNFKFYFHSAREGRKIEIIKVNSRVCFSISICDPFVTGEKACNYGMKFRSIVGYGRIQIITDENLRNYALNKLMENYTGENNWKYEEDILKMTTVTCLEVEKYTAKIKK